MAFLRKKDIAEDIKEIKEAVESKPEPLPVYPSKIDFPKVEIEKLPERPRFAPLFIKIDRYKEVLDIINGLKLGLSELNDILSVKKEVERTKSKVDSALERSLVMITSLVRDLDSELVKPPSLERPELHASAEPKKEMIGSSIEQLQSEINRLKQKLQRM